MQTKQLQIPIEMILELISSVNKTEHEYWDEAKEIDGIKDFDSLEPVLRITEYINFRLNTPLRCGSFSIWRYDKDKRAYFNLDNETPRMKISIDELKMSNSYYIFFEYKNEHFYIESYCELSKYIMGECLYTLLDLNGNEFLTVYTECTCSEGYYSIRCINELNKVFACIDEELEYKVEATTKAYSNAYIKAVSKGQKHNEAMKIAKKSLYNDFDFATVELQHKLERKIIYLQKRLNSKKFSKKTKN